MVVFVAGKPYVVEKWLGLLWRFIGPPRSELDACSAEGLQCAGIEEIARVCEQAVASEKVLLAAWLLSWCNVQYVIMNSSRVSTISGMRKWSPIDDNDRQTLY
jgi:hypothetical protein